MSKKKIAENRWWNFRQLVRAAGGNNAAARRIGLGDSVVQAYAGENARRNIGDKIAQKIETGFGLKPGTLDLDPPVEARNPDPYIAAIAATLAHSKPAVKKLVVSFSELAAASELATQASDEDLDKEFAMELAITPALGYSDEHVAEVPEKEQDMPVVIQPTNKKGKKNAAPATKETRRS